MGAQGLFRLPLFVADPLALQFLRVPMPSRIGAFLYILKSLELQMLCQNPTPFRGDLIHGSSYPCNTSQQTRCPVH
jgi:hypothetical protein